jgi:hypothetical protein
MLRLLRRSLLLGASLVLSACLSPTLPLPPPDRPDVTSPDASGMVRIRGVAVTKAEVIAWNRASDLLAGQVTTDDASYDFTMRADVGDIIELWYVKGTEQSSSVSVKVPEASAKLPDATP